MIYYALSDGFIAGAFESERAFDQWMKSVPADLRTPLAKQVDRNHSFPTFLVEAQGFRWLNEPELDELFGAWSTSDRPSDCVYGNLYFLDGPWQPRRAGTDAMGAIPHLHVERAHLELVQRAGLDRLHETWLTTASVASIRRSRSQ